jgi:hypothetical protein
MANHGYLPRDGRDISLEDLHAAILGAYNYHPATLDSAFQMAIDFNLSSTGNASTIHLSDLNKHGAIEHDGSLSRSDFDLGDNHSFDPEVWNGTATSLGLYDAGVDCGEDLYVTVEVAARARAARFREAEELNPEFNVSELALMGSVGETALYMTTLWDYAAGAVPKAWIRAFFGEFRNPFFRADYAGNVYLEHGADLNRGGEDTVSRGVQGAQDAAEPDDYRGYECGYCSCQGLDGCTCSKDVGMNV